MKLKNTLDHPDYFLRRMVSWCCKQLDLPASEVKRVEFKKTRSGHAYSGLARRGGYIIVRNGGPSAYPSHARRRDLRTGWTLPLADHIEGLVQTTAHELCHLRQRREGYSDDRSRREHDADARMMGVLKAFREQRESLMAAWCAEPAAALRPPKPKPSVIDLRAKRAETNLATWQRKLKLAQTKVKKYKKQVAYYEKNKGNP